MPPHEFVGWLVRIVATVVVLFFLFLVVRVFIPHLMNAHNDGALILAVVVGLAGPAAAAYALYILWFSEDFNV